MPDVEFVHLVGAHQVAQPSRGYWGILCRLIERYSDKIVARPRKRRKPKRPKGAVCKPCWELRYCPYGPLVEHFPLLGGRFTKKVQREAHKAAIAELRTVRTSADALDACDRVLFTDPATWKFIQGYDPEEVSCRIWGHVCPVFFCESGATETKATRSSSRYIPRAMMLQVVRRDDHVCQICFKYARDDEIEFDHVIPVARGGETSVGNLRLLCRRCNNRKSDKVDDLLVEQGAG